MAADKKNKRIQKGLVTFARSLGVLVMIGILLVLIPVSVPRMLGFKTYNVVSSSMAPAIPEGSLIMVKEIDPYEIKEGDVIAFEADGPVVSHRVVKNDAFDARFITKGDANEDVDLKDVQYDQLIGIVACHLPLLGRVGSYISTVSGRLMMGELIVVCMLLFIVSDRLSRKK